MGKYRIWNAVRAALTGLLLLVLAAVAPAGPRPPGVTLVSCDRSGAVIEVELPAFHQRPVSENGVTWTELSIPGWSHLLDEGKPVLPQAGILLALPPGSRPSLSVEVLASHTLPLASVLPAPTLEVDLKGASREVRRPEAAAYASPVPYPASWAELGPVARHRHFWVVPVTVTPLRAVCAGGQVLAADRLRLRISFSGGRTGQLLPDPHGESLARQSLLNYEAARAWQEKAAPLPPRPDQSYGQYKVMVSHDGLHQIPYADLLAAGIDPSGLDPRTLKLHGRATPGSAVLEQLPLWVAGEADGQFDPDDYVLFYGEYARGTYTDQNLFTRANVYWLDWGGSPGLRLGQRSAAPGSAVLAGAYQASRRVEVDTLYEKFGFASLIEPVDHWMWHRLDSNFEPQLSVTDSLPGHVIQAGRDAQITAGLAGYTFNDSLNPDHRALIKWNGQTVVDMTFDTQEHIVASGTVPWNQITPNGPNDIVFEAPPVPFMPANSFFLDWLRVDYWRNYHVYNDTLAFQSPQDMGHGWLRYQLTGLQNAQVELWNLTRAERLVDFTYQGGQLAFQDSASDTTHYCVAGRGAWLRPDSIVYDEPFDWNNLAALGVDYLIITHEAFYEGLAPLVSHYQGRGLRVQRVKVGDIYDEFNAGLKSDQAIFDFLQHAYHNYAPPAPAYVLLVGDASWDYRNYDALPYQDFLPTHAIMTYKQGETASDNWFSDVTSDFLPELYLGRFPVNDEEQLSTLIQKTLAYAQPLPGYWRSQIIFSNGAANPEDDGIYMDTTVQAIIEKYLPSWYDPPRVYANPSAGFEQYQGNSQDLIEYLNLGAACVNYVGHAGNQMWVTLQQPEIAQLTNGLKLPLVQAYSCFTGVFSNTYGFGEAFILHPGGGAIAYCANAAVGYLYTNRSMNDCFFQALFDRPDSLPPPTLGEAFTAAKWNYFALHGFDPGEMIRTFVLLGDPGGTFAWEDPNPADTLDNTPPQISITFDTGGPGSGGGLVANPVRFTCEVFDSTMLDHSSLSLELIHLADARGFPVDTAWTWTWEADSSAPPGFDFAFFPVDSLGQRFQLAYEDSLAAGEWQFRMAMADFFLQGPTVATANFQISDELRILDRPLNYPNPFHDETSFAFELTQPAQVTIKIYTVAGKLIRTLRVSGASGYNVAEWDGRDEQGDPLSNGAYLYKVIARSGDQQAEKVERMARIR